MGKKKSNKIETASSPPQSFEYDQGQIQFLSPILMGRMTSLNCCLVAEIWVSFKDTHPNQS